MTKVLFSILYTKISETVNDYYDKLATTIRVEEHTPRKSTKIMKKKTVTEKTHTCWLYGRKRLLFTQLFFSRAPPSHMFT
jgi:hypothetical protein